MKIRVRYFAQLRERMGREQEVVTLPTAATVGDVLSLLFPRQEEYDRAASFLRAAVNEEYVEISRLLCEGDDVVFIPPVAGG